jgi:hypothetical protein
MQLFKSEARKQLDDIFTSKFGITAVRPGVAPSELVKLAGCTAIGYRSVHDGMLTHCNVLATNKIQFFKFERETDLYCRVVNLTTQVFCHGCSVYCWNLVRNARVPYDALRHIQLESFEMEGVQFVKEPVFECRFGFGKKQRCGPSGQGNFKLGMEPVFQAKIEMDGNQQAKFFSERNHPRVLQHPVATLRWGCNADIQGVLTNNLIYDQIVSIGIPYHNFVERLLKLGLFGLEHYPAAGNLIPYVTSYNTKGNKSYANWTQIMKSIAN